MSTYFNIVNLDKKEQASLLICKTQSEVDATIKVWEKKNRRKWLSKAKMGHFAKLGNEYDPEGYCKHADGYWTKEIRAFYQHNQKMIFGFIFWQACGDQWGRVSPWFGDRVVIICDTKGAAEPNSPFLAAAHWYEMTEQFKPVAFRVSYQEWNDASR